MIYNVRFNFNGEADYKVEAKNSKEAIVKAMDEFKTEDPSANIIEIYPDEGSAEVEEIK